MRLESIRRLERLRKRQRDAAAGTMALADHAHQEAQSEERAAEATMGQLLEKAYARFCATTDARVLLRFESERILAANEVGRASATTRSRAVVCETCRGELQRAERQLRTAEKLRERASAERQAAADKVEQSMADDRTGTQVARRNAEEGAGS